MLETKGATAVMDGTPNVGPRPTLVRSGARAPKALTDILVDGLVTITPELAHRIIDLGKFDRQRPVRVKHVDALAMQMRRREWTAGTQIHLARTPDGELHLVNGQHRMHAVIKADAAVQFQILVTDAITDKDLIRLYRRHDRLVAPRTTSDALVAEGIMDTHALRTQIATGCFNAVLLIDAKFRRVAKFADPYLMRSDEARLRLAQDWWSAAGEFQEAIERAPANPVKSTIQRAGVMAVALVTLRYQNAKAYAFWQGLANNDGLGRADPRAAYLRHLYARTPGGNEVARAKAAALAWNAFYQDETLELVRVMDGPVTILGTPYAKPAKD